MRNGRDFIRELRREHPHMLGGSMWLLSGTLVVSMGSFIFWLLVARHVDSSQVGRATALFSATTFVCYLISLGLPIAISRHASDRSQDSATLFAWALVLTTAASLVAVLCFAALAPDSIRKGLEGISPFVAWTVVFLLVAGLAISLLVDVRLMALRRWSMVFWRGVLAATLRLPFLLWIPNKATAFYLYAVAVGGFAVTGVAFLLTLSHRGWFRLRPLPKRTRRAAHFAAVNYAGQLALQAPFFAVPFIVLVHVGATENARFYLSWGVMTIVYVGVQMISQALLVEGGRGGADHRRQASVSLGVGLAVTTVATLASLGVGPALARVYGPDYGQVATLLPILMAGTIPFAVTMVMLTTARIREHSASTLAMAIALAVAVLVPTVILTSNDGAVGAAWGWTIGNSIAAAIAVFASRLAERQVVEPPAPALAPTPGIVTLTAVSESSGAPKGPTIPD
jgi:O-antigen/teichoic acid export membrane protein